MTDDELGNVMAKAAFNAAFVEVARLKKKLDAALAVLRAVEWTDEGDALRCPDCRAAQDDGHHAGCSLAEALRAKP